MGKRNSDETHWGKYGAGGAYSIAVGGGCFVGTSGGGATGGDCTIGGGPLALGFLVATLPAFL